MKLLAKLLVCALALAAVTDAAETTRKTCDDGGDVTPLPTTGTPAVTTPAPTTSTPGQTTPAPTTANPGATTPAPTTTTPVVTTPAPTTATPVVTTPAPTTTAPVVTTPAPVPTTTVPVVTSPAPTTPAKFDKNQEYLRDGIDCAGYLRLPPPGRPITQQDCVLDYKVKFSKADEVPTAGCVVCEAKWGKFVYDASVPLASQEVPLCGKLPLCTRFKDYGMLTALDLMCVLSQNGAAPIDDPKVCGFGDN